MNTRIITMRCTGFLRQNARDLPHFYPPKTGQYRAMRFFLKTGGNLYRAGFCGGFWMPVYCPIFGPFMHSGCRWGSEFFAIFDKFQDIWKKISFFQSREFSKKENGLRARVAMDTEEFGRLINDLVGLPKENEWVEFKTNYEEPKLIGEIVSALANSAALHKKPRGYLVWGVEDGTHKLVGTTFKPRKKKVHNQELENWLAIKLKPRIDVVFFEGTVEEKELVVLEIQPAIGQPVGFDGTEWIRIGSYKKKLRDHPGKESALWQTFRDFPFEKGLAATRLPPEEVLSLIDYKKYFDLMGQPVPDGKDEILRQLSSDKIIKHEGGGFSVTNVGAILFAIDLNSFGNLARKAPRVIIYNGVNRVKTLKERGGTKGYAIGFEGLVRYVNDQLPQNEEINQALRAEVRMFPEVAIRELTANALIHQDFGISGAGPTIEIFDGRMEITNPGKPLIETLRFIDGAPISRNEILAGLMRRMGFCEERGSGIDKVISFVEAYQLPAPDFRDNETSTVAVLYGPREFSEMDRVERIRACYQHAVLWHVSGRQITNTSFRKRLGISDKNYPMASRIINDAKKAKLIKAYGSGSSSKRDAKYVPFWA